ncbi:hypothetical protein COW36_24650 [bacterium (Candidatus Blackallbacteria) CG17_big_fil_post_rev_8_21_14_2_50_48_46]|uniref:Uncharacterized protein n=1 Tax=bacterium (Candidatus Blackallbacteria) CG17_big_fil_post_rev_8_21_14_2_50_48_46 TaxID=2014261 RepID=A0A2M7FXL3_9BACT|nr:MAG: hypothetical protein COW64_19590 [bacterium (Candidatus Blackallbacteria) CG18_big_fil_WC_8_21_14_2_50_49_26]PIW13859.1 MAG: hypothetical protein COW36_24650 [bacterium (Candidatus Blackallbacteria) CG17_big_fil_post_rev_8_21_14_2_50_48_46]PIW45085.1 MAG: hypothetical protein COW20_22280 [bacterium (Candidatus Blackallbacteria) CG13_big_fil_rev_8_21_14_2_50_49_14]
MNLKELAHLRQRASHLDQNRHHQAREFYLSGLKLLAAAQQEGYQNNKRLTEALTQFLQALRLHHRDQGSALAAAYIFGLAGNLNQAQRYLRLILEVTPQHPEALKLQAQLSQPFTQPQTEPTQPASAIPDHDALYDLLAEKIHKEIHSLHRQGIFVPVLEPDALAQLAEDTENRKNNYAWLCEQRERVETEIDTSDLAQAMQILEKALKRQEGIYEASLKMQVLVPHLQEFEREVITVTVAMLKSPTLERVKETEVQLENMLDRCDTLADQIDELENKGFSHKNLTDLYHLLVVRLEHLQDKLDEVIPLR